MTSDYAILKNTTLDHAIPENTAPDYAISRNTAPDFVIPGNTAPDYAILKNTTLDHAIPEKEITISFSLIILYNSIDTVTGNVYGDRNTGSRMHIRFGETTAQACSCSLDNRYLFRHHTTVSYRIK